MKNNDRWGGLGRRSVTRNAREKNIGGKISLQKERGGQRFQALPAKRPGELSKSQHIRNKTEKRIWKLASKIWGKKEKPPTREGKGYKARKTPRPSEYPQHRQGVGVLLSEWTGRRIDFINLAGKKQGKKVDISARGALV